MAKKYVPNLVSYDRFIRLMEGNEYSYGEDPEAIAFEMEEIYPNGGVEINTYARNGGGSHLAVHIEDVLRIVAWCVMNDVRTYFVRGNYDRLEEF